MEMLSQPFEVRSAVVTSTHCNWRIRKTVNPNEEKRLLTEIVTKAEDLARGHTGYLTMAYHL